MAGDSTLKPSVTTRFAWRGLMITVSHARPDWAAGFDHIEVRSEGRVPIPFSETGYRSHFLHVDDIAVYGTAEDYVMAWLEHESATARWRTLDAANRQMTLF